MVPFASLQVGVSEVVLAVNYQPEVMMEALKAIEDKVRVHCTWTSRAALHMTGVLRTSPPCFPCVFQYGIKVTCSQETEPLGTGEASKISWLPAAGGSLKCVPPSTLHSWPASIGPGTLERWRTIFRLQLGRYLRVSLERASGVPQGPWWGGYNYGDKSGRTLQVWCGRA